MSAALTQLAAVVRKEVQQTQRDRRVLFLLIVAPLLQTVVFGYAVDFDIRRVPTVVVDLDGTPASREHLRRLLADATLLRQGDERAVADAERLLEAGDAAAVLVMPRSFEADVAAQRTATVQVLLDGSDPNRANITAGAAARYFGELSQRIGRERMAAAGLPPQGSIELAPRLRYNPQLLSPPYMVPGILAMLLIVVTTIVTAMGLSREREQGTLEQVLVTPIRPLWLLTGKMVPFFVIGLFDTTLVLTAATWLFGMPVRGNPAVLLLGTVLYLGSTLGVGLLISTLSRTQQQSYLGGFLFALPAVLLSGVVTPIRSMPQWLRLITWLNPLRYFAELNRGVLLKGASFADLAPQLAALALFGSAILAVATLRFRREAA
ncbi:MAG TPA: ABC transporter permease [Myxococcales bacterium]|nr:ABC transporter permease [Myxococcales bacterium]